MYDGGYFEENMTDLFINNILAIRKKDIPESVYNRARRCFLDYIACTVAGAKSYFDKECSYLKYVAEESGICNVLGHHIKATIHTAAMLNGISAHAIELDDGHRIGMIHLGAPIISALLSVAEKENMDSEDFLYGIIIGYEVAVRLSCAIQPGCKLNGYHATGVCGTIGAAMAIGASLDFGFSQLKSALSAAITSASGLLEMIEGDTQLKPFNAGRAAMDAVCAAYIGKAGFLAPEDALGGERGFLKVFTDAVKTDYLTDFSKGFFYIETIYNKPYAACRHTHPAIEAALQIRSQEGFKLDEVYAINVDTYKLAVKGHDHTEINGVNSAKMSIPYSLAVALVTGNAGLGEYSYPNIANEQILDVTSKVIVKDIDELSSLCPNKRVAIVKVQTKSGIFSARVDYPKGEPENPLSEDEFRQKFIGLMTFAGYSEDVSDKMLSIIYRPSFNIREAIELIS